jgi:hypothetical protein
MGKRLPYEMMTDPTLVYLALAAESDPQMLKTLASRLPLSLSEEGTTKLAEALVDARPTRRALQTIKSLLKPERYAALLKQWIRDAVTEAAGGALRGEPPSEQEWSRYSRDLMDELAESLPPDSPEGAVCGLRAGMKPMHISDDPEKQNTFLQVLSPDVPFGMELLLSFLTWKEVEPPFLLRLFEKAYLPHKNVKNSDTYLLDVAYLVMDMPHKANQKIIATGIYNAIQRIGVKYKGMPFKTAMSILENIAGLTNTTAAKGRKTPRRESKIPSLEDIQKIVSKILRRQNPFSLDDEEEEDEDEDEDADEDDD